MRRDQLEHAIRTACQIIGMPEVIVVGSQAILGSFDEGRLPADATMSLEVDVLPNAADNVETARRADLIEGVAGEFLHSRSCTGSASMAWTWRPRRCGGRRRIGRLAGCAPGVTVDAPEGSEPVSDAAFLHR